MAVYTIDTPVTYLNGVGKARAEKLSRLGIHTLKDLLYHFPRAYENRGDVRQLGQHNTDKSCAYILTVATEVNSAMVKQGMTISKFRAFDESGSCEVVFFNSAFVKDVFHVGTTFRFYGKASFSKTGRLTLTSPKYEPVIPTVQLPDFVPIYTLTDGITSKILEKLIRTAIEEVLPSIVDPLPEEVRLSNKLPTLSYAIKNIHFPTDARSIGAAGRRLAFDELLTFGLGIAYNANRRTHGAGVRFNKCSLEPLTKLLPYELTGAQKRAINDIYSDTVLKCKNGITPAMARILIGDVGSGKTVCAAAAMYIAFMSQYQSAIMVPTEILANQHYADLSNLLGKLGAKVALLTGSCTVAQKRKIYQQLENGEIDVIVGTHALLSDKIVFKNLGLIVTDEQHRFGVAQRAVLKEREKNSHVLVMSATPIPRTLALALYGDLDISRIDELPQGRIKVDTYVIDESYRSRLNAMIEKQVNLGGKCYIVCPAIEAEDSIDEYVYDQYSGEQMVSFDRSNLKNVIDYTKELKKSLPKLNICAMHGKMKAAEKDAIVSEFATGNLDVLVSTTVIEVGVNVPTATLMIIENAERFGLSQLHQLRGRVGRGNMKSYCVLVSDAKNEKARMRLDVMRSTNDGFEIADKDLLLRGPGEFFSTNRDNNLRQSGGFDFKIASSYSDNDLFNSAFSIAKNIISKDPEMLMPEHSLLRYTISGFIFNHSIIS